jgi:hypothetical protein
MGRIEGNLPRKAEGRNSAELLGTQEGINGGGRGKEKKKEKKKEEEAGIRGFWILDFELGFGIWDFWRGD